MSRVAVAERLAPEVPTSIREVRERLEALLEDIDVLVQRSDGRAFARPLKYMRAEVRALIAFYGETKPPATASRHLQWRQKNRNDGKERHCPKCDQWKPVEEFDYKDRRKGTLRSHCRPCWKAYQRERYVAANKKALIVELIDGDGALEARCAECGELFAIGDRVVGESLKHEGCVA